MKTSEYAGEFTVADVKLRREGNWYIVTMGGKVIARRYSRSGKITGVEVWFNSCRSPRYPRTWENLRGYQGGIKFLTDAARPTPPDHHYNNLIYKPLENWLGEPEGG